MFDIAKVHVQDILLGFGSEHNGIDHTRRLTLSVFVEHDVLVFLDEHALRERAVQGVERVLGRRSRQTKRRGLLGKGTHRGIVIVIVLEHASNGIRDLG